MTTGNRNADDTDRTDKTDDEPRAAAFGREEKPGSQTSRGTTPIGHGSVAVTQQHEASQDMLMGETDAEPESSTTGQP